MAKFFMRNPLKTYFTWGGELNRKEYLIWNIILLQLVGGFLMVNLGESIKEAYTELINERVTVSYNFLYLFIIFAIFFLIAYVNTTYKRMRTIRMDYRWGILALVPYISFVFSGYLFCGRRKNTAFHYHRGTFYCVGNCT